MLCTSLTQPRRLAPGIPHTLTQISSARLDMVSSLDPGRAVGAAAPWDPVFSSAVGDTAGSAWLYATASPRPPSRHAPGSGAVRHPRAPAHRARNANHRLLTPRA